MSNRLARRSFMKGLGALGVTLGFGSKVISREADKLSDEVIQEGVERGWYSQELANEIINCDEHVAAIDPYYEEPADAPVFIANITDTAKPDSFMALVEHDWSWELGAILERNFQVTEVPYGTSFKVAEPINQPIRRLKDGESIMYNEPAYTETTHEFDHMYCSFIIRDSEKDMWNPRELVDLFFLPSLYTFKKFIEEECEGKRLAVQRLPLPIKGFGVIGHLSGGGPIPIRTTAQYDIASAGTRVNLEFMAKVY